MTQVPEEVGALEASCSLDGLRGRASEAKPVVLPLERAISARHISGSLLVASSHQRLQQEMRVIRAKDRGCQLRQHCFGTRKRGGMLTPVGELQSRWSTVEQRLPHVVARQVGSVICNALSCMLAPIASQTS